MEQLQEQVQEPTKKNRPLINALKVVVLLVLVVALFAYANVVCNYPGTRQNKGTFNAFYNMPADSIDVCYVGSSATSRYFINPAAFHEEGIASFSFGAPNMPFMFADNIIKEVEKTQNPQLYIVEMRNLIKGDGALAESAVRSTTDSISLLSDQRYEMINEYLQYMGEHAEPGSYDDEPLDYYLPIMKYKDRVLDRDLTAADFDPNKPLNKCQGFYHSKPTLSQSPQDYPCYTDEIASLDQDTREMLDDFLGFIETLDAQVLFVLSPYAIDDPEVSAIANGLEEYVEERGYECLNFNTTEMVEKLGLDWSTDFYNKNHTDYLGAEKYTAYLSDYLKGHYELADHREDPTYDCYEEGYQAYVKYVSNGILYYSDSDVADDA